MLPAVESTNPYHARAAAFFESLDPREDIAISELVLLELYVLLRIPVVLPRPLGAARATAVCTAFREHPRWQVASLPVDHRAFHDAFWLRLRKDAFARRRAFDWRVALSLLQQGVTHFATANIEDFSGFGFAKVWPPLVGAPSEPG